MSVWGKGWGMKSGCVGAVGGAVTRAGSDFEKRHEYFPVGFAATSMSLTIFKITSGPNRLMPLAGAEGR